LVLLGLGVFVIYLLFRPRSARRPARGGDPDVTHHIRGPNPGAYFAVG
jgi:hypothetical protein